MVSPRSGSHLSYLERVGVLTRISFPRRSPSNPSRPTVHLEAHRLGVSSLSVDSSGTRALSTSIEGNVVLSDLEAEGGKVLGRKETFGEEGEDGSGTWSRPSSSADVHGWLADPRHRR
jgi:hypothetical protein